ncbi:MAG: CHASE domain-containing protein [Acidobacteria bacterium]|nr:CHASE domain-containing protein [Acidobacteriota bacterium]MBA3887814.1 CHASE domain-containing protein [Acidobacteriota bacterium]
MRRKIPRAALPSVILAAGLALTLLGAWYAHREGRSQEALEFANVAATVQHAIEGRLEAYVAMLRGGTGLFAGSDDVSPAEFRAYVARLELPWRYPGVQGIGFSQIIGPEEREAVAARARQAGLPFHYWPEQPGDQPVHAIVYLEPLDTLNEAALGYNMFSEPGRRAAMERARDTGEPSATGRVRLVQEGAGKGPEQAGFLIYMPAYNAGSVPATPEERRERLLGFVYSPFRADDLLAGVIGTRLDGGLHLEVYDGDPAGGSLLHRSEHEPWTPIRFEVRREMSVAGRPWTLVMRNATPRRVTFRSMFVLLIACGGTVLSALLFTVTRAEIRAREAAERTTRELRKSEEALRAANRAKDDFLAVVSHELRTPLNAILGWSLMLQRGHVPAERQRDALRTIHRNAKVQVKLVEDLLDMSHAVSGHLRLDLQDIDLAAVLGAALDSVRPVAEDRQVRIEWDGQPDLDVIRADPARIEQIVWNLLSNAIKFTPGGGVVWMSARRESDGVVLEVRDNGIGIRRDLLPFIFEPFRQGDASTTRAHGGVGLGLSIARHLVHLHGGTIDAASDGPNRGATFSVRLPLEPPASAAPANPAEGPWRR